jgi:hypothetical protein
MRRLAPYAAVLLGSIALLVPFSAFATTIFLTSGTTWTVPSDFNPLDNSVEVIGGGGGGANGTSGSKGNSGGGGGGYSRSTNIALTPGTSVTYAVGAAGTHGGSPTAGGDTYFCNSTSNCASISGTAVVVGAKGGGAGTTSAGGAGGAASSGVGSVTYSGGAGGSASAAQNGGSGGGGAAGPRGAGGNGGAQPGSSNPIAGSGGGGASGGTTGGVGNSTTGGTGGSGPAGTGGGAGGASLGAAGSAGTATSGGGGGGGGPDDGASTPGGNGGNGGSGSDWDSTHGAGGGGGSTGGANNTKNAGSGGLYGAGGGGGGNFVTGAAGGDGAQGLIVISYTPAAITNFQPDLTWIKDRSTTNAHGIFDSLRLDYPYLSSNSSGAETTDTTALSALSAGGFSLGPQSLFNTSGNSYVSWDWRGGGTAVTNTSGTITSTVSANTTAGFSVVTYTGNASIGATIGHGLGATPSFIIIHRRESGGQNWPVYHISQGATNVPYLENTTASFTRQGNFNNATPNSTTFTVGGSAQTDFTNTNASGGAYVAYVWAEVPGFSKFGSYTGNGSADGPFVNTGFKPRWILVKRTDTTGDWYIWDTARDTLNPAPSYLFANTTAADSSATNDMDILANGFKLRVTTAGINASGGTYIYAAFADAAFKYASAGFVSPASSLFFFEN